MTGTVVGLLSYDNCLCVISGVHGHLSQAGLWPTVPAHVHYTREFFKMLESEPSIHCVTKPMLTLMWDQANFSMKLSHFKN